MSVSMKKKPTDVTKRIWKTLEQATTTLSDPLGLIERIHVGHFLQH